jgi:xanthine dehydrogenase large subunit
MSAPTPQAVVGLPLPHESGLLHVTGAAQYTDDLPELRGTLHAAVGLSTRAHARIESLDLDPVRAADGVVAVVAAADVPGVNDCGPVVADDPIFAEGETLYAGQSLFAVAATSQLAARRAARLAHVSYVDLPALLDPDAAVAAGAFVLPTERMARGDAAAAIATAPHRLAGTLDIGGQDHFYLESNIAYAIPREQGAMHVYSSTQYPGEVQHKVAHALGLSAKDVVVECRRMGGGFGGKESQPALIACIAAVLARRTGRPVKLRLDRDDDMLLTGKRHDFRTRYRVGFDDAGRLLGVEFTLASRCGYSADLSGAINDRAMFHSDNAYFLEHVSVLSYRCRTHTVSNTAFRGFGGPQGMMGIERVIDDVARHLGLDPLDVRRINLYGKTERNVTHYGQTLEDNILPELLAQLETTSEYRSRRREIERYNRTSPIVKRGIAVTPVKFGISFTATHLNQAGALLHLYSDGTAMLNHGGTEMGQGLNTKVAQVVAHELQIGLDAVKVTASDTSKVPNASPTAASSGSDMNGMAAQSAARTLRARLIAFAATHFGVAPESVSLADGCFHAGAHRVPFAEIVRRAYMARIPLSATGFYATPKIHYDRKTFTGRPFYYFAYGAAVAEVALDTLTGESRVLRVDVLHDVGRSLNPAIDIGQIEGGFVQGMGWLTNEELWWDGAGRLRTHAPSTYKIPVAGDVPADFRVSLFDGDNPEETIFRSKAVGEPPLMLAMSVFLALRDAVASTGPSRALPALDAPATPERLLFAIRDLASAAGPRQAAPAMAAGS